MPSTCATRHSEERRIYIYIYGVDRSIQGNTENFFAGPYTVQPSRVSIESRAHRARRWGRVSMHQRPAGVLTARAPAGSSVSQVREGDRGPCLAYMRQLVSGPRRSGIYYSCYTFPSFSAVDQQQWARLGWTGLEQAEQVLRATDLDR